MKKYVFLLFTVLISSAMYSQIGIFTNSPDASSALDITSTDKGMLIPRMTTANKLAITSPQEGLMVYDSEKNCISIYTYLSWLTTPAMGWTCMTSYTSSFFYMPSINISTPNIASNLTLDLYDWYKTQFGASAYGSPSAIALEAYDADDLYYYVTYYDKSKIEVTNISASGVMTYNIVGHANYDSYMNIVFVVK